MEGFSCARIARRQGVPAATVRSRLERGLDELRARAVARGGGDRRAFAIGLCALVTGERGGVLSTLTGALAMQSATKLCLVAGLVAAGAGWWIAFEARGPQPARGDALPGIEVRRASNARASIEQNPADPMRSIDSDAAQAAGERDEPASPSPDFTSSIELDRARESLRRAAEGTLAGELDPGAFLDAALLLVQLEVDEDAIAVREGPVTRHPLTGAPTGVQAELLVHETPNPAYSPVNCSLAVRFDAPAQPYVFQGSARRDAEARIGVTRDAAGRPKSFYVATSFEPTEDPSDPGAHLANGTFVRGIRYVLDLDRPFEGEFRAEGLELKSGTPKQGTFSSIPWEVPMTLVGGAWPRIDDIELLSNALMARYEAIE